MLKTFLQQIRPKEASEILYYKPAACLRVSVYVD